MTAPREPDEEGTEAGPADEAIGLEEEFADVFDCGALEVSCHITGWFHGLVVGILEPLFGWIAGKLFMTPTPTDGITNVWQGVSATANTVYVLLIVVAGLVIMAGHSLQSQTSAKEILPRLVVGFVAANVSLSVVGLAAEVSTAIAQAMTADGIDSDRAAHNLSQKTTPFLGEQGAIIVLFLLMFVVLLVVWVIVEIVRIVIVILLMIGGPLMLIFHALPQTNRLAELWWRALAAVCLVPIAQAVAFVALMRLFFEGDTQVLFGVAQIIRGEVDLLDLFLLLVLVYIQIRIPIWAYKAVWSGSPGRSPAAGVVKGLVWAAVLAAASAVTGGGAAAAGGVGGRTGALMRAGRQGVRRAQASRSTPNAVALPRRSRTWRFGTPGTHHGMRPAPQNPRHSGIGGSATTSPTRPVHRRTPGGEIPAVGPLHTPALPTAHPRGRHRGRPQHERRHGSVLPDHEPGHRRSPTGTRRHSDSNPRHHQVTGRPPSPPSPPTSVLRRWGSRLTPRPLRRRASPRRHRPRPPWRWKRPRH